MNREKMPAFSRLAKSAHSVLKASAAVASGGAAAWLAFVGTEASIAAYNAAVAASPALGHWLHIIPNGQMTLASIIWGATAGTAGYLAADSAMNTATKPSRSNPGTPNSYLDAYKTPPF